MGGTLDKVGGQRLDIRLAELGFNDTGQPIAAGARVGLF